MDGAQDSQVQGGSPEKNTDALGVSCRIFAIVPAKPDLPPVPTGPQDSREAGGHLIFLLPLARCMVKPRGHTVFILFKNILKDKDSVISLGFWFQH